VALPAFSDNVRLFLIDEVGVVFNQATQSVYELNTAATFIWLALERNERRDQIVAGLRSTFGVETESAEAQLAEALSAWRTFGFFSGRPQPRQQRRKRRRLLWRMGRAPSLHGPDRVQRRCVVLKRRIQLDLPSGIIDELLRPVFLHLEVSEAGDLPVDLHVAVGRTSTGFFIAADDRVRYRNLRPDQLAPLVKALAFSYCIDRSEFSFAIHAGAVCDTQRTLVLPGAAGSGKTSLTAALVHRGLSYLSDDLILLDPKTLSLSGVPFSICVKEAGLDLLGPKFPALYDQVSHRRPDGMVVRYLPPPADRVHDPSTPAPEPAWLVFPHYDPQGPTELTALTASAALRKLLSTSTLSTDLTHAQVAGLLERIRGVEAFDLSVSDLEQGLAILTRLFGEPPREPRSWSTV